MNALTVGKWTSSFDQFGHYILLICLFFLPFSPLLCLFFSSLLYHTLFSSRHITEDLMSMPSRHCLHMYRYQRNTGRRKCILLLLLIILGLIVVLIFKPRRHASTTIGNTAPISAVSTAPNQDTASSDPDASQLPPLPILSIDLGSGLGGSGPKPRSAVNSHARKRDGRADSVRDGEVAERMLDSFPSSPTLMMGDNTNTRQRRPLEHLRMYYPVV